jgi:enamine deaminase RidA (YjgF/YER057c/UK114 family)
VAAGRLLFVSGHDPERRGRLAYRGRIGREIGAVQARAALRLATLNALAAATAAAGSFARLRRCLAVTCFIDAAPDGVSPALAESALRPLRRVFGGAAPILWLRPVRGLAGGMPVEVELLLELVD